MYAKFIEAMTIDAETECSLTFLTNGIGAPVGKNGLDEAFFKVILYVLLENEKLLPEHIIERPELEFLSFLERYFVVTRVA